MSNYTKSEIIFLHNPYLKAQAIKILKQKPEKCTTEDRENFWYVFNKLVPGYLGKNLTLCASVNIIGTYYEIYVEVNNSEDNSDLDADKG